VFIPSLTLLALSAVPPITSLPQAVSALRRPSKLDGLAALKEACRGKYRRELRDRPELKTELENILAAGSLNEKKAALDASPCFSAATFAPVIEVALKDKEDAVIAYAAEVSARLEEPSLVAPLHRILEPRKSACLGPDLSNSAAEVCVWLTYAPGALLTNADEATRKIAGEVAAEMITAEYPKIREVAVETLAATKMRAFAPRIAELLAKETKNVYSKPSPKELLERYREREKTLKRGK
jgi:hypothetical protein